MPDPIAVNSMFARIARRYDVANCFLSGGLDTWWRRRLVASVNIHPPRDILDLATGSGDVAFALSRKLPTKVKIIGMDFCQPMLDEAVVKQRTHSCYSSIVFCQGDGMALPLADATFDAVTISFGLRNMANRLQSLREMHRVLRTGGRLYILEFSQPQRWFKPIYYFYIKRILPRMASIATGDRPAYDYLNASIERYPDHKSMSAEILQAGFRAVDVTRMTFGIVALHVAVKAG